MTDLDLLFNAYIYQSGKTKMQLADHLGMDKNTLYRRWKRGIQTWPWEEVIKAAHFIGIPVDALREQLSYRKECKK